MPAERESIRYINAEAMERLSREEMDRHRGQYAVLVAGEIASYHATNREALETACAKYVLGEFSVQKVEPQPIEFRFSERLAKALLVTKPSVPPR